MNPGKDNPGPGKTPYRSKRSSTGGRRRQRTGGRRLFRNEMQEITYIWAQLSPDARRDLLQLLTGMLGETLSGPIDPRAESSSNEPVPSRELGGPSPRSPPRRQKIYEREIIRDLPGVREFSTMSSAERAAATGINRLMSVATGVIARAQRTGMSNAEITRFLVDNHENIELLQNSFVPSSEDDQGRGDSAPQRVGEAGGGSDGIQPGASGSAEAESSAAAEAALVVRSPPKGRSTSLRTLKSEEGQSWASACETSSSEGQRTPESGKHRKGKKRKRKKTSFVIPPPSDKGDEHGPSSGGPGAPGSGGGALKVS